MFVEKTIEVSITLPDSRVALIELFDTQADEYGPGEGVAPRASLYGKAHVIFLLFSIISPTSFENVLNKVRPPLPMALPLPLLRFLPSGFPKSEDTLLTPKFSSLEQSATSEKTPISSRSSPSESACPSRSVLPVPPPPSPFSPAYLKNNLASLIDLSHPLSQRKPPT